MHLPSLKNLEFNRRFFSEMFSKTWSKFSKTWTFRRAPKNERNLIPFFFFKNVDIPKGTKKRNETQIVVGFVISKTFPPSQTVFLFHQSSFLFFRNQVFKNVDIPKGTKKRNETQIVLGGFVISKTFPPSRTALVFRQPMLSQRNVIFKIVDIPNETKIADHVVGFLTFHSFLEHGCRENPETAPAQEQSQNRNSHPTN